MSNHLTLLYKAELAEITEEFATISRIASESNKQIKDLEVQFFTDTTITKEKRERLIEALAAQTLILSDKAKNLYTKLNNLSDSEL